jgi:hypothetical protein
MFYSMDVWLGEKCHRSKLNDMENSRGCKVPDVNGIETY